MLALTLILTTNESTSLLPLFLFPGIGPVLGLIFIPLIGSASDHCNSSYGRRRPFIWLLSLGVLLALLIIPHADLLAAYFTWGGCALQVAFLILGVGLLDFCGQVCFTPLEALLSDLYRNEEDCNQAFAMFSFMVSLGGCVGYLLPALDWSRGLLSVYLGGQAECLFFMLILIFVTSVLITMRVSEEPPCTAALEPGPLLEAGRCGSIPLLCLLRTCWSMTPAIYRSYCHVPRVMRQLCMAQLCSWMAVMSFMLFYTDFMGEGLYEGMPSAAPGTASRQRYEDGELTLFFLDILCDSITNFGRASFRVPLNLSCRHYLILSHKHLGSASSASLGV
ncbi:unnamed protein product [Oncorhynchus mykiss]|uniref:Solute carrier family 45 member 3 n=1 Tax=Oncorhynchus mykiss TaxID=8022 RepID=A0A060ZC26_ONCMY|nr:unnamed protein product [Oncorhynchus mykiss]